MKLYIPKYGYTLLHPNMGTFFSPCTQKIKMSFGKIESLASKYIMGLIQDIQSRNHWSSCHSRVHPTPPNIKQPVNGPKNVISSPAKPRFLEDFSSMNGGIDYPQNVDFSRELVITHD